MTNETHDRFDEIAENYATSEVDSMSPDDQASSSARDSGDRGIRM